MKNHFKNSILPLVVGALLMATNLRASTIKYIVDLNTTALTSAPNGPFYLDLQLNSGGGTLVSEATFANFSFTNGARTGTPQTSTGGGMISGNLGSHVSINEGNGSNEFFQGFTAGTTDIKFIVYITAQSTGVTPDGLSIAILNSLPNYPQILTDDPNDGLSLVNFDVGFNNLQAVHTYESIGTDGVGGVTTLADVAPEPSISMFAILALSAFGALRWRSFLSRKDQVSLGCINTRSCQGARV